MPMQEPFIHRDDAPEPRWPERLRVMAALAAVMLLALAVAAELLAPG